MNLHVDIFEKAQTMDVNFTESSQPFGSSMGEVQVLNGGKNGATFTPAVSAEGVVSWTNDRDLPNPAPVNIKGPKGEPGKDGQDGYTPIKGEDYFTDADKAEMVSAVIAQLPVYDGSVTTV